MNIAILGNTSWGRALATLTAEAGHRPHIGYRGKPPGGFRGSPNMAGLIRDADLVLVAVDGGEVRDVIKAARPGPKDQVVIATRGVEPDSSHWLTDVISQESACLQVGTLAGPALASEVIKRRPSAQVIASRFECVRTRTQKALHSSICRVYTSDDLRGVELAGAMVTVLTITLGLADALQQGLGVRGVIVTRGLAEATRLGVSLGARATTFAGLAGVGDVVACGAHPEHPGYAAGLQLGRNQQPNPKLLREVHTIAKLGDRQGVEMPMTRAIAAILSGNLKPRLAIDALMRRHATHE